MVAERRQGDTGEILVARDLVKRYGPFRAVDGVSQTVRAGEVFGLLGPNGAGKTTTVSMCTGLLRPSSGSVTIAGIDLQDQARYAKCVIVYVPDVRFVYV